MRSGVAARKIQCRQAHFFVRALAATIAAARCFQATDGGDFFKPGVKSMNIVKTAVALTAAAFVVGAAMPAQAQYLFPSTSAYGSTRGWSGWQASSVNSPNRDFPTTGAQPVGDYARTFGFGAGASAADANASCSSAHVRHRLANGHVVSRTETVCP
jgi:hypothetical protein